MDRIILFAKAPREGRVKTRLVPPLTPERAVALHVAMVLDQWDFLRAWRAPAREVELRLDGAWPTGVPAPPPPAARPQGDGDLGDRLRRAIGESSASGAARTAILGADAPSLPRDRIEAALALLDRGADAALVPAPDGGYVALAARRPCDALFEGIPWGTKDVLEATRRAARRAGLRVAATDPWGDVDRAADLPRLARELADAPGRAPRTQGLLASWRLDWRESWMV